MGAVLLPANVRVLYRRGYRVWTPDGTWTATIAGAAKALAAAGWRRSDEWLHSQPANTEAWYLPMAGPAATAWQAIAEREADLQRQLAELEAEKAQVVAQAAPGVHNPRAVGWLCSGSPIGLCIVDDDAEDEPECVFCHNPEERK